MESGVQNKIFITILSILSLSTFSEEFKVKKTWFGDPDLQGVWTNASLTTLERPDHFDALEISDEVCLLYTSPSPRDGLLSRMPSSA